MSSQIWQLLLTIKSDNVPGSTKTNITTSMREPAREHQFDRLPPPGRRLPATSREHEAFLGARNLFVKHERTCRYSWACWTTETTIQPPGPHPPLLTSGCTSWKRLPNSVPLHTICNSLSVVFCLGSYCSQHRSSSRRLRYDAVYKSSFHPNSRQCQVYVQYITST